MAGDGEENGRNQEEGPRIGKFGNKATHILEGGARKAS